MQENNQSSQPKAGSVIYPVNSTGNHPANSAQIASRKQDIFEILMLAFGIVTLMSLLFNLGPLLKLSAAVFLGVAIFAIVRNTKDAKRVQRQVRSNGEPDQPKKPRSLIKVLGITLLVLIALPALAYGGLIFIFILFLVVGGGLGGGDTNMGT